MFTILIVPDDAIQYQASEGKSLARVSLPGPARDFPCLAMARPGREATEESARVYAQKTCSNWAVDREDRLKMVTQLRLLADFIESGATIPSDQADALRERAVRELTAMDA